MGRNHSSIFFPRQVGGGGGRHSSRTFSCSSLCLSSKDTSLDGVTSSQNPLLNLQRQNPSSKKGNIYRYQELDMNIFLGEEIIFFSLPQPALTSVSTEEFSQSQCPPYDLPIVAVQLLSHIQLFATPWTIARQASLSFTSSLSLLKLMSIELMMPSNHLTLCCPLLLLAIEVCWRLVFTSLPLSCPYLGKAHAFPNLLSPKRNSSLRLVVTHYTR